jgi:hypothetical protein
LSQSDRRQPTPTMAVGIINFGETIIRANGAITRDGTAIVDGDGIITEDMTDITTAVMFVMTTVATTMMGDGTAITDEDGTITEDMTGITGVMFVMITVATIINRRFGRTSKIFAMREMKSNKVAGSCGRITRNLDEIERSSDAIFAMERAKKKFLGTAKRFAPAGTRSGKTEQN